MKLSNWELSETFIDLPISIALLVWHIRDIKSVKFQGQFYDA